MNFDSTEVMDLTQSREFIIQNGLEINSLEGYYYPDTYFFFKGETPKNVLSHLIRQHKLFGIKRMKLEQDKLTCQNMTLSHLLQ